MNNYSQPDIQMETEGYEKNDTFRIAEGCFTRGQADMFGAQFSGNTEKSFGE